VHFAAYIGAAVTLLPPGATTLHGLCRIGHGGRNNKIRDEDREAVAPLKLLIIDEFSCLGLAFLHTVSSRLSLLKGDPRPFGGISVLLNGDLFQLPPPGDAPSYKEIASSRLAAIVAPEAGRI